MNPADALDKAALYLAGIPGAAERATSRALNAAGVALRDEALVAITERYAVPRSDVTTGFSLVAASPTKLESLAMLRSGAVAVDHYPHAPTAGGTGGTGRPILTAEIRRGSSKAIAGAFVAMLSGGNPHVVIRTGEKTATGKDRLRRLYTMPVGAMLGVEAVRDRAEDRALAVLEERIGPEIDRELARAGGAV